MKLNIGSRKKHHKGYTTIDIESGHGVDFVGDFRKMSFEGIDEILAEHLLEHFSRDESIAVLGLWNKWLTIGGILIVETPDFEGICENFNKDRYWMTRHTYGSQEADWAFHKDGWYEEKFKDVLPSVGFEILSISKTVSRRILPNIKVVAKKIW